MEEEFASGAAKDDELRMMFSCCSPRLSEEAQVALILHILCGFSVDEIASAFVSSHAAVEKRIIRSKKALAASKKLFDISGAEDFARRLPAVQRALYLLFNDGYHGAVTGESSAGWSLPGSNAAHINSLEKPTWSNCIDLRSCCSHVLERSAPAGA